MSPRSAIADLPVWARIVAFIGFPTVAACYLIYLLGSGVQAAADTAALNSTQALRDLSMHAVRMEQLSESRDEENARLQRILVQICLNTAKVRTDAAACALY